jgi:hypothetical protein
MASSRSGTAYSCLSTRSLIREASANSTTASVASASVRTVAPVEDTVASSSTNGPTSSPISTKAMAGVNGVSISRRDTPATASRAPATIARSHFMTLLPRCRLWGAGRCLTVGELRLDRAVHVAVNVV